MEPDKNVLDTWTKNILMDLYTSIAGITSGYLTVVQRDFHLTKEEGQKEILKLDAEARNKVEKAYKLFDDLKGGVEQ